MTYSMTEIAALAAQAAAGAGATPAQSSAFGAAAVRHLVLGRAADDLPAALDALPGGPIRDLPVWLARGIEAADADHVELILPEDRWADLARSYAEASVWATETSGDRVVVDLSRPAVAAPPSRLDPDGGLLGQMRSLAALTLVPESAQSRARGAGAGLTDSD